MKKYGKHLLVGAILLLVSQSVVALCTAPNATISLPSNIIVQRDAVVGSTIASGQVIINIVCTSQGANQHYDGSWSVFPGPNNIDAGATSIGDVRATGTPGIGIRWKNLSSATGTAATWTSAALNSFSKNSGRGINFNGTTRFTDTFELVKTGNITSTVLPSRAFNYYFGTPISNYIPGSPLNALTMPSITVTAVACSVTKPVINVVLGNVFANSFRSIGSTSVPAYFTIPLDCDANARVNMELNATAVSDFKGVISVNRVTGAATGVGIQLLSGPTSGAQTPVTFGSPQFMTTVAKDGPLNFNFSARYYQIANKVTGGSEWNRYLHHDL
ncbi:fimbrial protein [Serratia sp. L9]|uniref:fimbrial protein n=1 Tax=Serratia sp. L9 TaxID=3423946 RepID=UPI003D6672A8